MAEIFKAEKFDASAAFPPSLFSSLFVTAIGHDIKFMQIFFGHLFQRSALYDIVLAEVNIINNISGEMC